MRAFLATIFLGQLGVAALAQGPEPAPESYPLIMEELPPHLESRRAENNDAMLLGSVGQGQDYYLSLTRFEPGEPVRVCFFEGSTALRARIAAVANRWAEIPDTSLKLDFGDPAAPRLCSSREFNHIRVGFRYKGYWSLVGRESVELAAQNEQSMNLARFNTVPPPNARFDRVVLHEFGHALGMYHEHQNEVGRCHKEYNWELVKKELMGDPNFWTEDQVNHNMGPRPGQGEPGPFDVKSIMIYSFPPKFYISGDASHCFATETSALSDGDIEGVRKLFPKDFADSGAIRRATLDQYINKLDSLSGIAGDRKDLAKGRAAKIAGEALPAIGGSTIMLGHVPVGASPKWRAYSTNPAMDWLQPAQPN